MIEIQVDNSAAPEMTIVTVKGTLDVLTRQRLFDTPCLLKPEYDTILDMEAVPFVDSSGLSAIVQIIKKHRDYEKRLVLTSLQPHVLNVLEMTSIDQIIPIMSSQEEARAKIGGMERP